MSVEHRGETQNHIGFIDTNVFVHAQTRDAHSDGCRAFLEAVRAGRISVVLDPLICHELTYVLPRVVKGLSKNDVANVILDVISWPGVVGNYAVLEESIQRWRHSPGLGFVDAYLATVAEASNTPVYTKNIRELRA